MPRANLSRFSGLSPSLARLLLLLLTVTAIWGVASPTPPLHRPPAGKGDAVLYSAIAARVARGQGYYEAAATEQRLHHYPLRPYTTMREPALAEIGAALGPDGADLLLRTLSMVATVATVLRLATALSSAARLSALTLAATSGGLLLQPGMWVWHETWAGLLIALALAVRGDRHFGVAVALGLAAALIRELALPFLPLMAVIALAEKRRTESAVWLAAAVVAAAALGWHFAQVAAVVQPDDRLSPGWIAFGGLPFAISLAKQSLWLFALPDWVAGLALPLALLGWAGLPGGYALRVTLLLFGWLGAFLIIGRPTNIYWGFLFSSLLPVGVALAPRALSDLVAAAWPAWSSTDAAEAGLSLT